MQTKVGQVWDDVWSEIRNSSDYQSKMGNAMFSLIDSMIERPFLGEDNNLYDARGYPFETESTSKYRTFFIDPRTRLFQVVKHIANKKHKKQKTLFELDGQLFYKFEDIWYRVWMKEIKKTSRYQYVPNSIWGIPEIDDQFSNSTLSMAKSAYGLSPNKLYWYCEKKESANHREIKKLNKQNGDI